MMTNVSFVVNRTLCNGEDFSWDPTGIVDDSDEAKCKTGNLVKDWKMLPAGYANKEYTITALNVPESTVILHDYCHGLHTLKVISNDYRYLVLADQNDRDKLTDSVVKSLFGRKILVIRPTEKVNPQAVNDEIKRKESEASATFYQKDDKSKLYDERFNGKRFYGNISPSKLAEAGWNYSRTYSGDELNCIYFKNHGRVGIQRECDGNAFITGFSYPQQLVHFEDCRTIASLEKMHLVLNREISCKEYFKRLKLQEKPLLINNDGVDQSGPLYQFCGPEDSGCSKAFILSHRNHPLYQVEEDEKRKILHDAMLTKLVETMNNLRKERKDNTAEYQKCLREFIWLKHFDNLSQDTQKKVVNYIDRLGDDFNHISENDKPAASKILANLSGINLSQYLSPLVDELAKYEKILTTDVMKLEGMDEDIRKAVVDVMTQKAKEKFTQKLFSFLQKPFISEPVAGYLAQGDFASKFVNLTDDTPERIMNLRPLAEAGNQLQVSLGLLQDKVRQLSNSRLDLEQIEGSAETPAQSIEVMPESASSQTINQSEKPKHQGFSCKIL